jgi:aspartyl protease family protein
MTGDRAAQFVLYAVMLILPLSALLARRLPLKPVLRMALAWFAIFAIGLVIASQRDRLSGLTAMFSDQQVSGTETRIHMAEDGHFWADVDIDGVRRRMLIDSGATTTAFSSATAKAARLDSNESRFPVMIETANGTVPARTATAKLHDRNNHRDRTRDRNIAGVWRDRRDRYEFPVEAGIMAGRECHARSNAKQDVDLT